MIRLVRPLLCGGSVGLLAAAATAALLSRTDRIELSDKALVVAIVAAAVAIGWWTLGAIRATRRWVRTTLHTRRVRQQRRRELAAARANVGTPVFDQDEITVPLDEPERALSRSEIVGAVTEAEDAVARGDFLAAAQRYSDVLDVAPNHVSAWLARGRVWLALGDYNRAMNDFVQAEDRYSDSPEPPVAVGELYFARKDYARAIPYFDVALTLAPNHAMALCRRGLSHHYRKCHALALDDLVRAKALDPDIPSISSHLSAAKRKVNEEKDAAAAAAAAAKAKARKRR